jgi:hypothetical protein
VSPNSKQAPERDSVLVLLDNWFLYARARRVPLPPAETFVEIVDQAEGDRGKIHGYLDCEFSLGQIRGVDRSWQVELSTLPYREGAALFELQHAKGDGNLLALTHSNSSEVTHWNILESNLASGDLASLFKPEP